MPLRIFVILCLFIFSFELSAQDGEVVIEGAIVISNNNDPNPVPGTIRWTGTNFEGWTGSEWVSLNFSTLDEADGSSSNEIQDLAISGNILTITLNGFPTQINLSPYLDNTDTQLTEAEVVNIVSNNGFLTTENDGDPTNELQQFSVSVTGDTLYLSNGNFVIVPGISIANALQDIDGNVYITVVIGDQEWMVENLKTTRYNDGMPIPLVTDNLAWENLSTPAYCWYNNDEATHKDPFGALYNWYAVETGKLCPIGWHVPSRSEFIDLLGAVTPDQGNQLKEAGTSHWLAPNTGTNESGFTALGTGHRNSGGAFFSFQTRGYFYTATEVDLTRAWYYQLRNNDSSVIVLGFDKEAGNSVRCLKD